MKQYCRYCCSCIENGYNDYYCTVYEKFISTNTVKTANKCSDYGYCGNDVITGKDHKLKVKKADDGVQLEMKGGK